jgi:hypothetical protein
LGIPNDHSFGPLVLNPLDRDEGFQITSSSSLSGLFLAQRPKTCTTNGIAQREALLSHLEHVHGKTIGVNLAIHISPKAMHLIALDISNGHQWPS